MMKNTIRLTESDLEKIIKRVIKEQQSQSKFPFAFDNKTTRFEGEIGKDGYLIIRTEMGRVYKVGPIDGVPFVGGTAIDIEKNKGIEKVYIFGKSGVKRELKFKPNYQSVKIQ